MSVEYPVDDFETYVGSKGSRTRTDSDGNTVILSAAGFAWVDAVCDVLDENVLFFQERLRDECINNPLKVLKEIAIPVAKLKLSQTLAEERLVESRRKRDVESESNFWPIDISGLEATVPPPPDDGSA